MYTSYMESNLYKKTVNKNLRHIRETKGLSTTQLAAILGVSQAKVSYIENGKGILSAADVAMLSRRLNVPVTAFFQGLSDTDERGVNVLIHHLVRFGAVLLAKPKGIISKVIPFEDVFVQALGYLEDPRLHQAFLAALITQALNQDIHSDRIFAQIGSSPFLVTKTLEETRLAIHVCNALAKSKEKSFSSRAKTQLVSLVTKTEEILKSAGWHAIVSQHSEDDLPELTSFVSECLDAKR